jgi:hypothetical protein
LPEANVDKAEQERLERGLMYVAMTRAEEMLAFNPVNLERLRIPYSAASRQQHCEGAVAIPRFSGFWVVGNDTEETAQYGGTACAGDIGTMHKDSYGLKTSMGTGRRVAKLVRELGKVQIVGPPKVLFLVLQDRAGEARARLECMTNRFRNDVEATIIDISDQRIMPCIACDICPTRIDVDEVYRCVISSTNDSMPKLHRGLLRHDAIIPVVLSSAVPKASAQTIRSSWNGPVICVEELRITR